MKLIIEGELIDLNAYVNAERANRYKGAKIKKDETDRVYWQCRKQGLRPYKGKPVEIIFSWYCKNKKKDKDNISSMGRKVLLDGLVLARVLEGDGWNDINDFSDRFYIDKKHPRIEVDII